MGTQYNVTDLYHVAREFLYILHNELEKRNDIEVMPIPPGEHKLYIPCKDYKGTLCYPNIRCEVPGCGLTVLKFDDLLHVSTTLDDEFLVKNDWDNMKRCFIGPMGRSIVEMICNYHPNSYLYFVRLMPGEGSDGTAWHTSSHFNEVVRASSRYITGKGMQLVMETCCSAVSRQ